MRALISWYHWQGAAAHLADGCFVIGTPACFEGDLRFYQRNGGTMLCPEQLGRPRQALHPSHSYYETRPQVCFICGVSTGRTEKLVRVVSCTISCLEAALVSPDTHAVLVILRDLSAFATPT